MRPGYIAKHYGLTGQTIMVRERTRGVHKEIPENCTSGDIDKTPRFHQSWKFPWEHLEVPLLVTGEYPKFLCCTVLPHKTFNGRSYSRPYPVTINKFDIFTGDVIINGGAIK